MVNQLLHKLHWKHLMLFLICLIRMDQVHAQYYKFVADNDGTTIYYTATGSSATVIRGDEHYSGDVIIPTTVSYDGKVFSVVAVGRFAFSECVDLTSITLPASLLSIEDYAFNGCTSLHSIVVPNSVTAIGVNAFDGCTDLVSVALSESLKSIEHSTFSKCRNLRAIDIPSSVRKIGDMAFNGCRLLQTITMPNSVSYIGTFAFAECSSLESLIIPNQLTSIEKYSFSGCSRLKALEIPNSVAFIDEWAFYNCSGLNTITIPNSVNYIGKWAFWGCNAITEVVSEIETPFDMSEYVFERDVRKKAILHVLAGTKDAYQNVTGWDFKNIEEEKPSLYHLIMWAKDSSKIATYALAERPKVTFNENRFAVECTDVEIEYYELEGLARFTYEKDIETAIGNVQKDGPKFKMNRESIMFFTLEEHSTISIYSINGSLVLRKTLQQTDEYTLPISNLTPGVYIINVNSSAFKIIKK